MTKREASHFLSTLGEPGYVLDFTKQTLSDFIFDLIGLELESYTKLGDSNGKRLMCLLMEEPQHADTVVDALTNYKENR